MRRQFRRVRHVKKTTADKLNKIAAETHTKHEGHRKGKTAVVVGGLSEERRCRVYIFPAL